MYSIILSFLMAFALTYFAIPPIVQIAKAKRLYDEPGERSSHKAPTPSLGGIGIFAGMIFSIVFWTPFGQFASLQYILCALLILFLIGAKDDISPVSPSKKMVGQVMAASILVLKSGIVLQGVYGLFGIERHLPFWLAGIISVFTILVIINAFNLIDGINGLAGSLMLLVTATLGSWFAVAGHVQFAIVAFATAGATMAFLKYNYSPAQIFMGDTGSLVLGLTCALLIIEFIDLNERLPETIPYKISNAPVVAIGVILLPLFDMLRVFITRIIRGHSPFMPDRRHIHHLLIDGGHSHTQATAVLCLYNMFIITLAFGLCRVLDMHLLLLLFIALTSALTYVLHTRAIAYRQQHPAV